MTPDKQIDFFTNYGASQVRPMQGKHMKGIAFIDFATREQAQLAYQQLDKLYMDSSRKGLSVEYATNNNNNNNTTNDKSKQTTDLPTTISIDPVPVAPELGFNYPSNPHLLYQYPTPTPDIMNNMMNAIATVPRLYTQVLHLMNKMNLPPPFGPTSQASIPSLLKRKRDELLASDESEIESDKEDEQEQKLQLRRMAGKQRRQFLKKA
ncbi:hypothetical protein BC941DRAFT_424051 [Chlamydoabsidia padenii]|nr:hypothetical protein BC941DRAFT_424051 [Chlamydoabsidia padenii]